LRPHRIANPNQPFALEVTGHEVVEFLLLVLFE
jgi:hypothetical protein